MYYILFLFIITLVSSNVTNGQEVLVKGVVYDSSRLYVLSSVSVLSTSGKGTITNEFGEYEIEVDEKDSIWFSYLEKPTVKFPVASMYNTLQFDISIQIKVTELPEVRLRPRNYKQDSLQNRQDYAKAFNYKKPGLKVVTPTYGAGAGFDLQEIINMFRVKRNRSMASFQRRLIAQEQDNAVSHRFSKGLVRRLTQLEDPEIDSFMLMYRPSYEFTLATSDYEFQEYILIAYDWYKRGLPHRAFRRPWEIQFENKAF